MSKFAKFCHDLMQNLPNNLYIKCLFCSFVFNESYIFTFPMVQKAANYAEIGRLGKGGMVFNKFRSFKFSEILKILS